MTYEILFSVLLPLALWFAYRTKPRFIPLALALLLVVIGISKFSLLVFIPMFLCGSLLARFPIPAINARWKYVLLAIGVCLFANRWIVGPIVGERVSDAFALPAITLGSMIILILSLELPRLRETLSSRSLQSLGARSYSVYLVQSPIIVAVGIASLNVVDASSKWWPLISAIALFLALVGGWAFFRVVEQPAHKLAQSVGRTLKVS